MGPSHHLASIAKLINKTKQLTFLSSQVKFFTSYYSEVKLGVPVLQSVSRRAKTVQSAKMILNSRYPTVSIKCARCRYYVIL